MPLIALLFSNDPNVQLGENVGGLVTGGGLAAIAIVLLPVLDKWLKWRAEQRAIQIEFEKAKRLEDAQYKQDSANLFREMIIAITNGARHSELVDDSLKNLTEKVQIIYDRIMRKD